MAESFVQLPTDSVGKKMRTIEVEKDGDKLHQQVVVLADQQGNLVDLFSSITRIPEGKQVTKIGFWEDSDGNIRYIKFYDGEEVLFTLEFSNAGTASSETWSITRT